MNKNKGFTLIELMVTLAVMGIITAMAAPSFGNMLNKQNLNKSSQELITTLNRARSIAVVERRVVEVKLTTSQTVDTPSTLHWLPSGKATLKTGSADSLFFGLSGGVFIKDSSDATKMIPASADTTFTVCNTYINNEKNAKTITISRMGTIQPTVEGTC